jgi:hypothetical protein
MGPSLVYQMDSQSGGFGDPLTPLTPSQVIASNTDLLAAYTAAASKNAGKSSPGKISPSSNKDSQNTLSSGSQSSGGSSVLSSLGGSVGGRFIVDLGENSVEHSSSSGISDRIGANGVDYGNIITSGNSGGVIGEFDAVHLLSHHTITPIRHHLITSPHYHHRIATLPHRTTSTPSPHQHHH